MVDVISKSLDKAEASDLLTRGETFEGAIISMRWGDTEAVGTV